MVGDAQVPDFKPETRYRTARDSWKGSRGGPVVEVMHEHKHPVAKWSLQVECLALSENWVRKPANRN